MLIKIRCLTVQQNMYICLPAMEYVIINTELKSVIAVPA